MIVLPLRAEIVHSQRAFWGDWSQREQGHPQGHVTASEEQYIPTHILSTLHEPLTPTSALRKTACPHATSSVCSVGTLSQRKGKPSVLCSGVICRDKGEIKRGVPLPPDCQPDFAFLTPPSSFQQRVEMIYNPGHV